MTRSKPKKNDPRWVQVATTSIPDPAVRHPRNGNHRVQTRHVVVSQLIDDDGQHWEKFGRDEPECLGRPPAKTGTKAAPRRR